MRKHLIQDAAHAVFETALAGAIALGIGASMLEKAGDGPDSKMRQTHTRIDDASRTNSPGAGAPTPDL